MSKAWMPFYVADYLADTTHLSTEEHGAYLLLIMHYWQRGGLPSDEKKLARICKLSAHKWKKLREEIIPFFGEDFSHARLDQELAKANDISEKRSEAARKSNAKAPAIAPAKAPDLQASRARTLQSQSQLPPCTPHAKADGDVLEIPAFLKRSSDPLPRAESARPYRSPLEWADPIITITGIDPERYAVPGKIATICRDLDHLVTTARNFGLSVEEACQIIRDVKAEQDANDDTPGNYRFYVAVIERHGQRRVSAETGTDDPEQDLEAKAKQRARAIRRWDDNARSGRLGREHGPEPTEDEIAAAVAWKPGDEPVPVQCVDALRPADTPNQRRTG